MIRLRTLNALVGTMLLALPLTVPAQAQGNPIAGSSNLLPHCLPALPTLHQVCGAIGQHYSQLGGATSWLSSPVGNEMVNPDGAGYRQQFRHGFIYWHPKTGAHAVNNQVAAVWAAHGWEAGPLGYPLGGEVATRGNDPLSGDPIEGWKQEFQGGTVFRSPTPTGQRATVMWGKILERYNQLGGPSSPLGFPVTDELVAPDGVGRYQRFQEGVIVWHPTHGAWEIFGMVHLIWQARGEFASQWGYPVAAPQLEANVPSAQRFSGGTLDVGQIARQSGTEMLGDKEVSSLMMELLKHTGAQPIADNQL